MLYIMIPDTGNQNNSYMLALFTIYCKSGKRCRQNMQLCLQLSNKLYQVVQNQIVIMYRITSCLIVKYFQSSTTITQPTPHGHPFPLLSSPLPTPGYAARAFRSADTENFHGILNHFDRRGVRCSSLTDVSRQLSNLQMRQILKNRRVIPGV